MLIRGADAGDRAGTPGCQVSAAGVRRAGQRKQQAATAAGLTYTSVSEHPHRLDATRSGLP
jgi:hypothetical protein